jgi:phosphohistidine phosphatase SixA
VTWIYPVRHRKAGNRLRWTEADHTRPLTKSGRGQAKAFVALLEEQRFSRLASSPTALRPAAHATWIFDVQAGAVAGGRYLPPP